MRRPTRLYGVKMGGIRSSFNIRAVDRRAAWMAIITMRNEWGTDNSFDIFPVEDDGRMVIEVTIRPDMA